jgi:hypothetical protein
VRKIVDDDKDDDDNGDGGGGGGGGDTRGPYRIHRIAAKLCSTNMISFRHIIVKVCCKYKVYPLTGHEVLTK